MSATQLRIGQICCQYVARGGVGGEIFESAKKICEFKNIPIQVDAALINAMFPPYSWI